MSDGQNDNRKPDSDPSDFEPDFLSRLRDSTPRQSKSPFQQPKPNEPEPEAEEPEEDFWAALAMITHTGERFTINVCFRSRKHYNTEMHKFDIAKNLHVVLRDANDESIVIKRDMLLHILPSGTAEESDKKAW